MKICTRCKQEKELGMFYKDKRHLDGLTSHCKKCCNECNAISHSKNPELYRNYHKNYVAPYQANNPNYIKASLVVKEALAKGTIKRSPCIRCGNPKTVAHHPFYKYSEPLNIVWVCGSHHKIMHSEEKLKSQQDVQEKINNEYKNNQLNRVENSIDFYLSYHHIPEPSKTMIKGNILCMIKNEFKII
jgi:hypothetical protein